MNILLGLLGFEGFSFLGGITRNDGEFFFEKYESEKDEERFKRKTLESFLLVQKGSQNHLKLADSWNAHSSI